MTSQVEENATTFTELSHTRAAIWRGGGDVVIESVPLPVLQTGEVLVRVRLATVCGSDRHTVTGRRPQPCPSSSDTRRWERSWHSATVNRLRWTGTHSAKADAWSGR